MFRDLYTNLSAREQRAFKWSAAATAAALWLSTAWADPWPVRTLQLRGANVTIVPHLESRVARTCAAASGPGLDG